LRGLRICGDFRSRSPSPSSSNLACFFCSQLLSVTKHRVGLSQNQLRAVLHDECRALPVILKGQCFTFVEKSLPEIYFSLNYDFSTKDICVRLNICDENNPFAVSLMATFHTHFTIAAVPPTEEFPSAMSKSASTFEDEKDLEPTTSRANYPSRARQDRLGEEKRITCAFCERMLENAKNYAVTAKADIHSFANTACSKLPNGLSQQNCYGMADKKIAELAKFVDQQVIEALWCAELNQC
uniref:Surfactant protein B n=1 Tax=Angiostrongylus cantonensis TaxID=6313 RepID=A0A0K0DBQ7_ANGCA